MNSATPTAALPTPPLNAAAYDSFTYQANDGTTNLGTATVSITHTLLSQTITFGALGNQTLWQCSVCPGRDRVLRFDGWLRHSVRSATVTNGNVTITGVGLVTVVASQGNAAYAPATSVTQSFTVNPATLTVTANNQSRLYGATNPVLTARFSGFVNGDTNSALGGSLSLTCPALTNSPVAGYTITVAQGTLSAANYTFAFVNGTPTVNPATLIVTANNQAWAYGTTNPVFTANYNGFVNNENSGVLGGSPSLDLRGRYEQPGGPIFDSRSQWNLERGQLCFQLRQRNLTVGQATLLVTANNQARAYGVTNPVLTYTITGFLGTDTVSVVSGTPAISTTALNKQPRGPISHHRDQRHFGRRKL